MGLNSTWLLGEQSVIMLLKAGVWVLTTQKPVNRPGWLKEKFALFWMLATGVGEDRCLSKSGLPPPLTTRGARTFID